MSEIVKTGPNQGQRMAKLAIFGPLSCIFIRLATYSKAQEIQWVSVASNALMLTIIVISLVMGVMALLRVRVDGVKGIVGKAVAGILLNAWLIFEASKLISAYYSANQG